MRCYGDGNARGRLYDDDGLTFAYERGEKLWVDLSLAITDQGLQVLGGHGFIREHPVELWYRNARTLGVLEGTVSI